MDYDKIFLLPEDIRWSIWADYDHTYDKNTFKTSLEVTASYKIIHYPSNLCNEKLEILINRPNFELNLLKFEYINLKKKLMGED